MNQSLNSTAVLCPHCGYDRRGSSSPRCPECGAVTAQNELLFVIDELAHCERCLVEACQALAWMWIVFLAPIGFAVAARNTRFSWGFMALPILGFFSAIFFFGDATRQWLRGTRRLRMVRENATLEELRSIHLYLWGAVFLLFFPPMLMAAAWWFMGRL